MDLWIYEFNRRFDGLAHTFMSRTARLWVSLSLSLPPLCKGLEDATRNFSVRHCRSSSYTLASEGIMDWLRKYRRLETRCKVGPLPGMDTIDRAISTILPDNRGVPSRPTSTDTNDASLVAEAQGIVLDMCTKQPPSHYSKHPLCQVLPSLRVKSALLLLQGLIQRWLDHDAIVGRLLYLFQPLKQHYISREKLPSVMQAALRMFLLVVSGWCGMLVPLVVVL
ncbi:hypothetical protein CDL15_Pgr000999 [Punica granatum]|uniref:Uncharacterized protein n=1 Tax=Punica granatum TaxID=22663 RepID=A0A218XIP8_PUNGR|nr:hypothetical protein CDL15_Pgr000999 [Punica granatum]